MYHSCTDDECCVILGDRRPSVTRISVTDTRLTLAIRRLIVKHFCVFSLDRKSTFVEPYKLFHDFRMFKTLC